MIIKASNLLHSALFMFTILLFSSCKEDDQLKNDLEGKWFSEIKSTLNPDQDRFLYQDELQLKSNGEFEQYRRKLDRSTKAVLGFNFKIFGNYDIRSGRMIMTKRKGFESKDQEYVAPEAVNIPINDMKDSEFQIELLDNNTKLRLIYKCGPSENCLPDSLMPAYSRTF